jgi:hypothetical protein
MIRVLFLFACGLLATASVVAQDTAVTYQGRLMQDGAPYAGAVDLTFRLYDLPTGGTEVAGPISETDWPVVDGLFQVTLDFGAVFDGSARYLEVEVDGTILTPRQSVRPAPVALFALAGNDWQLNGADVYYLQGDVGIGTASPNAPLEIASNSQINEPQLLLTETEDDFARLTLANDVSERFWTIAGLTRGASADQDRLNVYHSTQGDLLTVSAVGSVGIRNNSPVPEYALDVNGGALVRRNNDGTSLPHLYFWEPAGEEPIRMFWRHGAAGRHWILSGVTRAAGVELDRFALENSSSGVLMAIQGNGRTGLGIEPLSRLSVRSDDQWSASSGNGRGDFYVGDGGVGLSVGVALGGGGRGVSRIWTSGGVEHLFLGSAAYGTSLSILPGQVGVNNSNPQATLDVDGDLRVRELADPGATANRALHVLPDGQIAAGNETLIMSIANVAFDSALGNALPRSFAAIRFFNAGVNDALNAPLTLPNGAEIVGVTAWFRDTSATNDLSFRVSALEHGTNFVSTVAWGSSTGDSSGYRSTSLTVATLTGINPVDNETRSYYVRVNPVAAGDGAYGAPVSWTGDNAGVQAIVIHYRQY